MVRFSRLILIFICLWPAKLLAETGEPLPAYSSLYASVYEQTILLKVMKAEDTEALQLLLADATEMDMQKEEKWRAELKQFIKPFKRMKNRYSDSFLLERLFHKVHRKYLKQYQSYLGFYELLESGRYNCLSSTALYALLLEELEFKYRIIETDYHIFLMVETGNGEEILIESTDPRTGLVKDPVLIEERLEKIKKDVLSAGSEQNGNYYDFNLQLFREISLRQLAGLQYYNKAAYLYNNRKPDEAAVAISKGRLLYQTERFDRFAELLVQQ